MRWFFLSILLSVLTPALAKADDLRALQGAVAASTQRAAEMARNRDTAHDETLRALKALSQTPASEKARAAYDSATTREQAAAIGELQAAAALRNARQRLTEAVNSAFEQGEAIERAAARAARGELTPSVTDPLACDGPDCVRISAREHAALVLMGAVGASFDPAKWPPPNSEPDITLMRYAPDSPPLATLRRAAEDAAQRAKETQSRALTLRATLTPATADIDAYTTADAQARAARAAQESTAEALRLKLRFYGDMGRAVKRAALLAGDGYSLKSGGKRACVAKACTSAEGLEAAAFAAIGAADDKKDAARVLKDFVVTNDAGSLIFR